jgi:hypothetical protein
MTKRQQINNKVNTILTELSKTIEKKNTFTWFKKTANGCQKYGKITKFLFWIYEHKEERKRKERQALPRYNRDLYVEP